MDPVTALGQLGGVACARDLLRFSRRREIRRAVRSGRVHRVARGRYALPDTDSARRTAAELSGVLCLRSAALAHGWRVPSVPQQPEVAVRRGRRLTPQQRSVARVHWLPLATDDVSKGVTTPLRTVVD